MPHASTMRRVSAPLPLVWEVFTDVPRLAERLAGVTDIEVLTADPDRVGARWRETRTLYGRTATEEFEVVTFEPERRYEVAVRGSGAHYRTEYVFDALGASGATVLATFTARGSNLATKALGVLAWPVTGRTVRKLVGQDVDDLAAYAERAAEGSL